MLYHIHRNKNHSLQYGEIHVLLIELPVWTIYRNIGTHAAFHLYESVDDGSASRELQTFSDTENINLYACICLKNILMRVDCIYVKRIVFIRYISYVLKIFVINVSLMKTYGNIFPSTMLACRVQFNEILLFIYHSREEYMILKTFVNTHKCIHKCIYWEIVKKIHLHIYIRTASLRYVHDDAFLAPATRGMFSDINRMRLAALQYAYVHELTTVGS